MKIRVTYTWEIEKDLKKDYPENFTEEEALEQEILSYYNDPYSLKLFGSNFKVSGEIINES